MLKMLSVLILCLLIAGCCKTMTNNEKKEQILRADRDFSELSKEKGIGYRQIYKECIARKRIVEKVATDGTC